MNIVFVLAVVFVRLVHLSVFFWYFSTSVCVTATKLDLLIKCISAKLELVTTSRSGYMRY